MRSSCARAALFVILSLASSVPAFATAKTWIGTSSSWNAANNWNPSGVPGAADDVTFSATTPTAVTLDVSATVKNVTVSGGAYVFTPSGAQTLTILGLLNLSGGSATLGSNITTNFAGA